jgi:hypothetical protein
MGTTDLPGEVYLILGLIVPRYFGYVKVENLPINPKWV